MVLVLASLPPVVGGCWVQLGTPETASSRSASLVKASFANVSAFKFLLHGMTSMEAAENKLSYSFALSR